MNIKNCKEIILSQIGNSTLGSLSVVEANKEVPFEIKRVYYIYDLNDCDVLRGKHAHKETEQAIFCLKGSFVLGLDDGENKEKITVDKPNEGIYLGTKLWHDMSDFSDDCVMLVLASDYYREEDYLREYSEFLQYIDR